MPGECFLCSEPASDQYTLVREDGPVIEDKFMCPGCVREFREEDWMEVHESPVLMRGGDPETDTIEDESD